MTIPGKGSPAARAGPGVGKGSVEDKTLQDLLLLTQQLITIITKNHQGQKLILPLRCMTNTEMTGTHFYEMHHLSIW